MNAKPIIYAAIWILLGTVVQSLIYEIRFRDEGLRAEMINILNYSDGHGYFMVWALLDAGGLLIVLMLHLWLNHSSKKSKKKVAKK